MRMEIIDMAKTFLLGNKNHVYSNCSFHFLLLLLIFSLLSTVVAVGTTRDIKKSLWNLFFEHFYNALKTFLGISTFWIIILDSAVRKIASENTPISENERHPSLKIIVMIAFPLSNWRKSLQIKEIFDNFDLEYNFSNFEDSIVFAQNFLFLP